MQLSEHQEALLQAIKLATKDHETNTLIYKSEWLGYLPFGQYHWVEVAGKEVDIKSSDTLESDLASLEHLHFLKKISVNKELVEKEDIHVYYEFNPHNAQ